jgi:hypothetical protein
MEVSEVMSKKETQMTLVKKTLGYSTRPMYWTRERKQAEACMMRVKRMRPARRLDLLAKETRKVKTVETAKLPAAARSIMSHTTWIH